MDLDSTVFPLGLWSWVVVIHDQKGTRYYRNGKFKKFEPSTRTVVERAIERVIKERKV